MLYDDNTTEDADAETIKEDVTINGERKIPGRQKVVRGSNVQVFNFARGSESPFVHCTQPYGFVCQPLRGFVTSAKRELSMLNTKKRILAFFGMDFLSAKISRFKKIRHIRNEGGEIWRAGKKKGSI